MPLIEQDGGERFTDGSGGVPEDIFQNPKAYEDGLPALRRSVALVRNYERSKPKGKQKLVSQIAVAVVKNPELLGQVYDNFDLIAEVNPSEALSEIRDQLPGCIEKAVARSAALRSFTPEKIEGLVRAGLESSGEKASAYEQMMAALFNAPRTVEQAVDLHYNAAWAMVVTDKEDVREEIFSVLCYEKDWFPAHSIGAQTEVYGGLASEDVYISRHYAAANAIDKVGVFLETPTEGELPTDSERAWSRVQRAASARAYLSVLTKTHLTKIIKRLFENNPTRTRVLMQNLMMYDPNTYETPVGFLSKSDVLNVENPVRENAGWPENVIENPIEPLNRLIEEHFGPRIFLAQWENTKAWFISSLGYQAVTNGEVYLSDGFLIDIIARDVSSPEEIGATVREVRETLIKGEKVNQRRDLDEYNLRLLESAHEYYGSWHPFDRNEDVFFAILRERSREQMGRLDSTISYYRPILSLEQAREAQLQAVNLRQHIRTWSNRSVRRGYEHLIADPTLRSLGYESITFSQNSDDNSVRVSLVLGGEVYRYTLDSSYRIQLGDDVKQFQSLQDQAWLELLTLSHLKKVVCTEEHKLREELLGGERQYKTYQRQIVGRGEHLRKQALGNGFSERAFKLCLKSGLHQRNLFKINKDRGETKETGMWTYVSPVDIVDSSEFPPVKVVFANATDDMRAVIPLEQVSAEELERIEEELLSEIGIWLDK